MALAGSGGSRHRIHYDGWGIYTLSWRYEVKYSGSRLLSHRSMSRTTDKKGAERFAKKWNIPMPPDPK